MSSEFFQQQRQKSAPGPGPRLKAARIKAGLEIAELAAQLRLRKQVIEDLENNDYTDLPPSVFVQGYYRNMADVLGLPKAEITQAYFQAINHPMAETSPEPVKPTTEISKETAQPQTDGKGLMGRLGNGFKGIGSKPDPEQQPDTKNQGLPAEKPLPKTRPLPLDTKGSGERPKRREPVLDMDREPSGYEAHDYSGHPKDEDERVDLRQEPRSASRLEPTQEQAPEPRPVSRRPAGLGRQASFDPEPDVVSEHQNPFRQQATTRDKDRGRGISFSIPSLSLPAWRPKNPGVLIRKTLFFGGAAAVLGLVIWGLTLIPMQGMVDGLMRKWSALIDSPQSQSLPPQVATDVPSEPVQPSADAQLLEPPPLTDSLLDFEPPGSTVAPEPAEEKPAKKSHKIIVTLKGDSWVEIEDATKEYRLVGELKKGSVHELKGSPPYRMLFGRGNLVKVSLDGKDYDFSKHQQGSVARFSLNP